MKLGQLRLNVEEVVRNKTAKDTWPLKDAVKGDIQLTLSFQPLIFEDTRVSSLAEASIFCSLCWANITGKISDGRSCDAMCMMWRSHVLPSPECCATSMDL